MDTLIVLRKIYFHVDWLRDDLVLLLLMFILWRDLSREFFRVKYVSFRIDIKGSRVLTRWITTLSIRMNVFSDRKG